MNNRAVSLTDGATHRYKGRDFAVGYSKRSNTYFALSAKPPLLFCVERVTKERAEHEARLMIDDFEERLLGKIVEMLEETKND